VFNVSNFSILFPLKRDKEKFPGTQDPQIKQLRSCLTHCWRDGVD